jgi:hypothetical protein
MQAAPNGRVILGVERAPADVDVDERGGGTQNRQPRRKRRRAPSANKNVASMRANVEVDRHAAALRRKTYAPAHGLRRNAVACPRRTTC